jgi:hypothetical protein
MTKSTIPKQTRQARVFFRPYFGVSNMEKSKTKAAGLVTQAAYQNVQSNDKPIQSRIKAAIVALACWGLLPISIANWIIQRGGLRDA